MLFHYIAQSHICSVRQAGRVVASTVILASNRHRQAVYIIYRISSENRSASAGNGPVVSSQEQNIRADVVNVFNGNCEIAHRDQKSLLQIWRLRYRPASCWPSLPKTERVSRHFVRCDSILQGGVFRSLESVFEHISFRKTN